MRSEDLRIISDFEHDTLLRWLEAFLLDRKAQNFTAGTIDYYREKLGHFLDYCTNKSISHFSQLSPEIIRAFLLDLERTGHNPGGILAHYRTLHTFLSWYEAEEEPENWKNPIRRVKSPKVPIQPIEPISNDAIEALLATCKQGAAAVRDRALILFLFDTGARVSEVIALDLADIDQVTGAVLIRQGKGRKPRTVYLAQKARRAFRAYVKRRADRDPAAWVTVYGERLTVSGINQVMRRRAKMAGIKRPGMHDFRRAFALNFLRNGGDIFSLQKLMGHSDIQVLRRYLAQTEKDIQEVHRRGSPADKTKG
jgi:site-specific recombinase XerD